MSELFYNIRWLWKQDTQTPMEIGTRIQRSLRAFAAIDPLIASWTTSRRPIEALPVEDGVDAMTGDLTSIVEAGVYRDPRGGPPDPDSGGYWFWAWTGGRQLARMGTPRTATFTANAGYEFRDYCTFEVGSFPNLAPDTSVVTYPLYHAVMLAALADWPAAWACARCSSPLRSPAQMSDDPSFPYSQYQAPWIGYLTAERTNGLRVPPELATERTPDGGLLMIAAKERLDPGNPDHMARSKLLARIMIERGGDPAY